MLARRLLKESSKALTTTATRGISTASGFKNFELTGRYKDMLTPEYLKERANEFEKDGFTIIHDLYDHETIDRIQEEMDNIITKAEKEGFDEKAVFTTSKQIETLSQTTDYFLDSASKISFFYEKDAFDAKGNLKAPLNMSLNKVRILDCYNLILY